VWKAYKTSLCGTLLLSWVHYKIEVARWIQTVDAAKFSFVWRYDCSLFHVLSECSHEMFFESEVGKIGGSSSATRFDG
jgi:hypothetical protein